MGEVSDIDSMAVARPDGGTVRVPVELAGRGYDILIGAGLIGEAGRLVAERLPQVRFAIVTDTNVAGHHLAQLEAALGPANLRGSVVPVVDLRIRFNVGKAEYDTNTIVIVINIGKRTIGMVVDGVSDVVILKPGDLRPAPEIAGVLSAEYLQGIAILDKRMLIVVDIDGLMTSREMGLLESAAVEPAA